MSWKQRALEYCERYGISIEDQSSSTEYRVTMEAPPGHLLWESDSTYHTAVRSRRGNTKAQIWFDVYNAAICGTICGPFCDRHRLDNIND